MNNKKKNILLGVLVVGVVAMTVAFAALATNLRISGTANTAATSWNIHFANWATDTASTVTYGGNTHQNTATYPAVNQLSTSDNSNVTKVEGVNITLGQPGDYAKYNFEIVNDGSIEASLSSFTPTIIGNTGSALAYTVNCYESASRSGTPITTNYVLASNGGKVYCNLEVKYKDVTNAQTPGASQVYTQSAINATISAAWTWVQNNTGSGANTGTITYYSTSATSGTTTFDSTWNFWVQESGTTKEVCGKFNGTPVCLTPDSNGRASEFGTKDSNNNYIVTGYTATKKAEFESLGASCSVGSYSMVCIGSGIKCYVGSYGDVNCRTSDSSHTCRINRNGDVNCD